MLMIFLQLTMTETPGPRDADASKNRQYAKQNFWWHLHTFTSIYVLHKHKIQKELIFAIFLKSLL